MRGIWAVAALVLVTACAPARLPTPTAAPATGPDGEIQSPEQAALTFVSVVERVEPIAEAVCRTRRPDADCDLQIVIDGRYSQPPNAFQTLDRRGRPIVGFTLALIADARNADEIAFVLSHEAAHHIAGHVPRSRESARAGAVLAGEIAMAQGAGPREIRAAQEFGAALVSRSYSKEFELEADALGTEIALLAGYDPVRGAAFFSRLPDPGDRFLGSHPPNAQRQALVRATVERLR